MTLHDYLNMCEEAKNMTLQFQQAIDKLTGENNDLKDLVQSTTENSEERVSKLRSEIDILVQQAEQRQGEFDARGRTTCGMLEP